MPLHEHKCEGMKGRMEYDWQYQCWYYHSEQGRWASERPDATCPICHEKMVTIPEMTLRTIFNADIKPFMDPKEACKYASDAGFCYVAMAGIVHLINAAKDGYEAYCIRYLDVGTNVRLALSCQQQRRRLGMRQLPPNQEGGGRS